MCEKGYVKTSDPSPNPWDCDSATMRVRHYPHEWKDDSGDEWLCYGWPSWAKIDTKEK